MHPFHRTELLVAAGAVINHICGRPISAASTASAAASACSEASIPRRSLMRLRTCVSSICEPSS